jgi:hypothetical protein
MITPAKALHFGDLAALLTPADLTNFRVNVGVRTFSSPATINVQYGFRSQSNKDFPANTFQQFSLTGFGDTAPVANERSSSRWSAVTRSSTSRSPTIARTTAACASHNGSRAGAVY